MIGRAILAKEVSEGDTILYASEHGAGFIFTPRVVRTVTKEDMYGSDGVDLWFDDYSDMQTYALPPSDVSLHPDELVVVLR